MEEFLGKEYVMVSDQNFDDYLVFMGVSYMKRKTASIITSIVSLIKNEDGTYSFIFRCKFVSSNATFTPGVRFIETKADGVKVDALITFDGNKMTHIQTESNGRTSTHVREFYPDRLVVEMHEKYTCKHCYKYHPVNTESQTRHFTTLFISLSSKPINSQRANDIFYVLDVSTTFLEKQLQQSFKALDV